MENGRFQVAFQLGGKVSIGFPWLERALHSDRRSKRRRKLRGGAILAQWPPMARGAPRSGLVRTSAVHRGVIRRGRAAIDAATHPANRLAGEEAPASAMA